MQKTKRWLCIFAFVIITGIIDGELLLDNVLYTELSLEQTVLLGMYEYGITFIPIVASIYYMFRWSTKYNMDNFGYRSRKEWKKGAKAD